MDFLGVYNRYKDILNVLFESKVKWDYDSVKEEASKYKTRAEFEKGCGSAYSVARKNGWLDDYDWFIEGKKPNGYWDYETVKEEASKYKTKKDFERGNRSAYSVARENGWMNDYDWFVDGVKRNAENKRKWNKETCKEEAKKYKTRTEFRNGSSGAFQVAQKKGWLDDYDWFGDKRKPWSEETCKEEAMKYKTRGDFAKGSNGAYQASKKNGWLDDYDWFENGIKLLGEKRRKWNEETCKEEAMKYKTKEEFKKGCGSAYSVARKNGWLDDYDWFVDGVKRNAENKRKWNKETCKEEAKKYKTRTEFRNGSSGACEVARQNGWLDDYDWFEQKQKPSGYWNKETCKEESLKYKTKSEFAKGCPSAYKVACREGWLDEYTWLRDARLDWDNGIDNVYAYYFEETNAIYVGRTVDVKARDRVHIFDIDKDAVAKYAHEHNCSVPEVKILETGLTLEQGQEQEHYWVEYYREQGYTILNKAKTGKGIGSLGSFGQGKWTKEKVREEAKKYKTRGEFAKWCQSAYNVARKKGWLNDYDWFEQRFKPSGYWNEETCKEEAKKYKNRKEFQKGCGRAYSVASKYGWLNDYDWFEPSKTASKWNEETCKEEAKKYKTKKDFERGNRSAYSLARRKGWLNDYEWFVDGVKLANERRRKWNYETVKEEAMKYKTRGEFQKGCESAYQVARNNKIDDERWIDIFFPTN